MTRLLHSMPLSKISWPFAPVAKTFMPPPANQEFLDRAAVAIGRGLKRMGPRLTYETISAEEADGILS
jgi:hypothetical protein